VRSSLAFGGGRGGDRVAGPDADRSGLPKFVIGPRSRWELLIKRLAVPETALHEHRPLGHVRLRIGGVGEEPPELRMMPAEIVAGAVPVPPDALSQTQDLLDEFLPGELLELIIGCHHAESLRRP
jgi:hypothetical protein